MLKLYLEFFLYLLKHSNKNRIIKENLFSLMLTYEDTQLPLTMVAISTGGAMIVAGDIIETLSGLLNKQRKERRRH